MPSVQIDTHEIREAAADFSKVPGELARHAIPVVKKAAVNVKNQMRSEMASSASFGFLARSITFDLNTSDGAIEAEIGPTKTSGGKTGLHKGANIAYFGSWKGGGTVPDPRGALEAEAPSFEEHLAGLAESLFG